MDNYFKCKCIKCTKQDTDWWSDKTTKSLCLTTPPNCMQLFYIVSLIMFPLWVATAISILCLAIDCEN